MVLEKLRVAEIIDGAHHVFADEPQLIELDFDKYLIVGDTHGDLDTSLSAIRYAEKNGLGLIFLGDYVDRGPKQLENLMTLLEHKLSWGRRFIMLRGNHESRMMNRWYGFFGVVAAAYGPDFYQDFARLFSQMPYAALIGGRVLCVHGGIPDNVSSVYEIRDLPKGELDPEDPRALQLVWNDPCEDIDEFAPSWRGGGAMLFGRLAFDRFMARNGLELMVRGHEPQDKGYGYLFGDRLLTVFSCRYYGIRSAGAVPENLEIEIVYFE
jgi:diadenosine tetraphosphatase ApaH/serine/threonine PP2A family protein phosphatase